MCPWRPSFQELSCDTAELGKGDTYGQQASGHPVPLLSGVRAAQCHRPGAVRMPVLLRPCLQAQDQNGNSFNPNSKQNIYSLCITPGDSLRTAVNSNACLPVNMLLSSLPLVLCISVWAHGLNMISITVLSRAQHDVDSRLLYLLPVCVLDAGYADDAARSTVSDNKHQTPWHCRSRSTHTSVTPFHKHNVFLTSNDTELRNSRIGVHAHSARAWLTAPPAWSAMPLCAATKFIEHVSCRLTCSKCWL